MDINIESAFYRGTNPVLLVNLCWLNSRRAKSDGLYYVGRQATSFYRYTSDTPREFTVFQPRLPFAWPFSVTSLTPLRSSKGILIEVEQKCLKCLTKKKKHIFFTYLQKDINFNTFLCLKLACPIKNFFGIFNYFKPFHTYIRITGRVFTLLSEKIII